MRATTLMLTAVTVAGMSLAQGINAQTRDDIGPNGLNLRGDGSVDDSQSGAERPVGINSDLNLGDVN
ncbi:MAG: hypothetical protein ACI856_002965, partial [Kiritimatiellia bacterium]